MVSEEDRTRAGQLEVLRMTAVPWARAGDRGHPAQRGTALSCRHSSCSWGNQQGVCVRHVPVKSFDPHTALGGGGKEGTVVSHILEKLSHLLEMQLGSGWGSIRTWVLRSQSPPCRWEGARGRDCLWRWRWLTKQCSLIKEQRSGSEHTGDKA